MNKAQKQMIKAAIQQIEETKTILDLIGEQEQSKFDNLSEGLQGTSQNQTIEENANKLSDAVAELEEIIENLKTI